VTVQESRYEAKKALNCLFIAVEEYVARDVQSKVQLAFDRTDGEVSAVLSTIPPDFLVRVCEDGGKENIYASLAVSVAKLVKHSYVTNK
jgi:hypothetical protein